MHAQPEEGARVALRTAWAALGGAPGRGAGVELHQPERLLASCYDVAALATGCVAAASLALAEWIELDDGSRRRAVRIDGAHAAAAFACERLLRTSDWELPAIWDPLAGDYRTADGFVRLHTNYSHHRDAVLVALDVPAERAAIARAVGSRASDEVERAVVAAGGCAAAMRSEAEWATHPAGRAVAAEPLVHRR